jgi:hypothetical protein
MSAPGSTGGPRRIGPPQPPPPAVVLKEPTPRGFGVALAILGLTIAQLILATLAPDVPQFHGTLFYARLICYPVLMIATPVVWWIARRRVGSTRPMPWAGFALIMLPFLIDVSANALDAYNSASWWHPVVQFVDWFLLGLGAGVLLLRGAIRQPWVLGLLVTGIGAVLAICWEIGHWYALVRGGADADVAYTNTLTDETLGTLGATTAGILFWVWRARRSRKTPAGKRSHLHVVKN